ncbi:MAG: hypothetical protein ACXW3D_02080 [Caulobacteraceae bacterium]
MKITIPFKGERAYIQGPDLFQAALDHIRQQHGEPGGLRFSANSFIRSNQVVLSETGEGPVRMSAMAAGQPVTVVMAEGEMETGHRVPFDEAAIWAEAMVSGLSATGPVSSRVCMIEHAVSLNKLLLSTLYPTTRKWVFTRAELESAPRAQESVGLTCLSPAGARLYKSSVAVDGASLGFIYFTLV